jgi:hypothetical protein
MSATAHLQQPVHNEATDKPMQLLEHQKLKCSRSSGHSWHHSSEGQELACSMVWIFLKNQLSSM